MAMIDIEYRHSSEPPQLDIIRRKSNEEMKNYLMGLVADMLMSDISAKYTDVETKEKNSVIINGQNVHDILDGLEIRILDSEDACDLRRPSLIKFERPTMDWEKEYIEDIPDVLMKNAISKIYSDSLKDRIM